MNDLSISEQAYFLHGGPRKDRFCLGNELLEKLLPLELHLIVPVTGQFARGQFAKKFEFFFLNTNLT